ncbi:MAG: response regulator [Planctomycetes bacterium]|nr:response regulator [Planctomycetota bacterium]
MESSSTSSSLNREEGVPGDPQERLLRAEHIVASLEKGVAILGIDFKITWANDPFREWCSQDPIGKSLLEALDEVSLVWPEIFPFDGLLTGKPTSLRLQFYGNRYLDVTISPFRERDCVVELIALCSDVSETVSRQQKLDALHRAGQELAALDADELTEMTVDDRVELLKQNLRRHIHDLLNYNVIEIRLLNPATQELKPLLEEGMTPEAAQRVLYARAAGNGVTGYVGATGQSYLCRDAETDPHYIKGAEGARSSMTVPLVFQDATIGTFNVESPKPNAFGPEDLQFAELFSREIAQAMHTLNLLRAQQSCTAVQAIEAVNRDIALPVDDLLSLACTALKDAQDKPELVQQLEQIIANTRTIKQKIQNVGDDFARLSPGGNIPIRLRGMRILVIDCDERIRRSAHALLEKEGCQVETAATGQEGITLARASHYDAVLMAIRHPDIGGTALYRSLRELQPDCRVILCQGFEYDGSHTLVNVRQDGYWLPVLYKPYQPNQLFKALTCSPPSSLDCPSRQPEVVHTS